MYIYIYDTVYNCTLWYYHGGVYATVTSYFTNSHFHVEYYCYAIVKQAIYYIITDVNETKSKLEKKTRKKNNKAVYHRCTMDHGHSIGVEESNKTHAQPKERPD